MGARREQPVSSELHAACIQCLAIMNRHHATCVCSWCVSSGHTHVYTCACDYACAAHTGTGGDGRRVPAVHRGQIQNRLITEVHPQRSASGSPNFLQKHTGTDWDKSRSNKMISQCTPAKHVHPSAKGTACESVRPTARDWKSRPGIFPYFNVIKFVEVRDLGREAPASGTSGTFDIDSGRT